MPFVIIQPIQVRSRKRRRALNDAWTVDGLRTPGVSEWVDEPWRWQKGAGFFDLPGEIRNMIYSFALTTKTRIGLDHMNGGRHIDGTNPCPYAFKELLAQPASYQEVISNIRRAVWKASTRTRPFVAPGLNVVSFASEKPSIKDAAPKIKRVGLAPTLLRTCKKVYAESHGFLYENTFYLRFARSIGFNPGRSLFHRLMDPIPHFHLIQHLVVELKALTCDPRRLQVFLARLTSLKSCRIDFEAFLLHTVLHPWLYNMLMVALSAFRHVEIVVRHADGGPSKGAFNPNVPYTAYYAELWPDNRVVSYLPCYCWRTLHTNLAVFRQNCTNRVRYQCGYYTLEADGITKTAWNLHPRTIDGQLETRNEGSREQLEF